MNLRISLLVACALVASGYAQSSLFDRYEVNSANWAKLPSGEAWDGETPSVATDGKGTVVVLVRKAPHFRFFKSDGTFIKAWGDDDNTNYHSVYFGPDGIVWLAATNNHVLMKFSPDGQLLMTLGKRGVTGDNASKEAFNRPNALAIKITGLRGFEPPTPWSRTNFPDLLDQRLWYLPALKQSDRQYL